ncbi:transporter substrate-binding domain-containing protein [Moraxella lincolnii]|nr:transporter substrate-binding domain-containing protein [Moraxella lincolnii]
MNHSSFINVLTKNVLTKNVIRKSVLIKSSFAKCSVKPLSLMLLFATASLLSGCGGSPDGGSTSGSGETQAHASSDDMADNPNNTADTASTVSYKVYTDADGMPFTYRDESGQPTGFDIDVMNAIAQDQHFAVTYEVLPWSLILPGMAEGKADIAIAHISITPERQKTHNFSNSYYVSHQAALTKPELANITSFKGLDGHRVEVLSGSIQEEIIQQMGISTTNKDMVFPLIKSLVNEQTDAVVLDSGILQYYQQQQADMNFGLVMDKEFGDDPYGIVVKKDNTELLNQVNQGLANIRQNGKYQQIEQKWFGQ